LITVPELDAEGELTVLALTGEINSKNKLNLKKLTSLCFDFLYL
jgi:hypothetical protein